MYEFLMQLLIKMMVMVIQLSMLMILLVLITVIQLMLIDDNDACDTIARRHRGG